MNTILATVFLKSGGSYTHIFSNEWELDTYFDDNQHLVSHITTE